MLFLETGIAAEKIGDNGTGEVYLFYAPDTTMTFGEEHLRALPDREYTRVV